MAISKQKAPQDYQEHEQEEGYSTESGGSDPDCDSDTDPSYSIEETRRNLSSLSIRKKSKPRVAIDLDVSFEKDPEEKETKLAEVDEKSYEEVHLIIQDGKLERLKVDQCKDYLRKNKLRLTGKKDTLIQRIKEHQEILNGGGEKRYPISSFVLDCKGDACRGDIVVFEQNVYEMYNIASRSAHGGPIGTRMVAGRIVKESYGAAKQQHTFTIEVLWSKGEKPLPPLHPLRIKGRNLYRLKTLRQRWEDEGERHKALLDKHLRGSLARSNRETRIQDKEKRKMFREERSQLNRMLKTNLGIQGSSVNLVTAASQSQRTGLSFESTKPGLPSDLQKNSCRENQDQFRYNSVKCVQIQDVQTLKSDDFGSLSHNRQDHHSDFIKYHPRTSLNNELSNKDQRQPLKCVDRYLPMRSPHRQGCEHPKLNADRKENDYRCQVPGNSVKYSDIQDVEQYRREGSCSRSSNFYRKPLASIRNSGQIRSPHRQGYQQTQLCRYFAKGRCHFGHNCKFLHELTEEREQRREERWPCSPRREERRF